MKKIGLILLSFLVSIIISSCLKSISELNQITKGLASCSVNQDNANNYYNKYGKDNKKITVNESSTNDTSSQDVVKKAFEVLSNVPQEYLEYVFVRYNIPVHLYTSNKGGLTSINLNPMYPQIIKYTDIRSLPHEFGHAAMGYVVEQYSSMQNDLTTVANLILNKYKDKAKNYITNNTDLFTGNIRDQGQQNRETFAEIFDTWYCSKAARNNLRNDMPEVYEFAQKYLISLEEDAKDINLYILNSGSNFQIYFSDNKNLSNITYSINSSNKTTPSSFKNNTNNNNLYKSEVINISNSSFNIEVYSNNSIVRKVEVSK